MKLWRCFPPLPRPGFVSVSLAVAALAVTGPAQDSSHSPSQYISRAWQKDDGLPQSAVDAIAQTADGYLWAGTRRGLARFNGVDFKVFDSEQAPALKSSRITGLCRAPDGGLWIGTAQGGLVRMKNGKFERYEVGSGPEASSVRNLVTGTDGVLWIGTASGLFALRGGKVENLAGAPGDVRALCSDRAGGLWVGTANRGVYHVKDERVVAVRDVTSGLPHNSVRSLCLDRSGTLWVGTMLGVTGLRESGASIYYGPTNGLSDRIVTALYEDHRGTLWIGTFGGLHHLANGKVFTDLDQAGAAYTSVSCIIEDAEGNVWVGTTEGLHRLQPRRFTVYTVQQGLSHNNVTAVLEDRAGAVWFATWGGGVCKLENGHVSRYTRTEGFSRDLIIALWQDHTGTMWAGADLGRGLVRYSTEGTRARVTGGGVPGTIRVIYEDRATNLWVGTAAGLYRLHKGESTRYTMQDGLANDTIRALSEDHAGRIWIGTSGGVSCWQEGQFQSFTATNQFRGKTIYALGEDTEHNLWVGTDAGLVRIRDGKFTAYTTEQGLFDAEIYSVLDDAHDNLWMSCPNGIFSVRRKNLDELDRGQASGIRCISYGKNDGMVSAQCSGVGQPSAWRGKDGSLWFPTLRGAAVIPPDARLEPNDKVPPVFIEEVLCDGKPAGQPATESLLLAGSRGSFCFAPGRGELEFRYAALSFQAPEKNRFKYLLEGVDSQWVSAGERRAAYYNNVAPGTYCFRVKAANNDGIWNEEGAFVRITLRPHYWQTWWFRVLFGAAFVGLVAGTGRYVERRRLREQMRRLEQDRAMERERARIARDIHDDLGARLTKISKLSERARNPDPGDPADGPMLSIHSTAQEMLGRLDETVWAVNPRNDRLDRLADYLLQYAEEFFRHTNIRCRLKVASEVPALAIAAEPRHHLFLAVKEALNNAARHSGASEVQLQIEYAGGVFRVQVRDNGRGFNGPEAVARGRGLDNMRSRLELLSGRWDLQTQPGQGTTIKMEFNMAACDRPAEAAAP
jgi:signal transduction histidine kinase/streptogramin lyase